MSEYLHFWQLASHSIIQAWGQDLNVECWGFILVCLIISLEPKIVQVLIYFNTKGPIHRIQATTMRELRNLGT